MSMTPLTSLPAATSRSNSTLASPLCGFHFFMLRFGSSFFAFLPSEMRPIVVLYGESLTHLVSLPYGSLLDGSNMHVLPVL